MHRSTLLPLIFIHIAVVAIGASRFIDRLFAGRRPQKPVEVRHLQSFFGEYNVCRDPRGKRQIH
jgi:hypothetical protein